MNTRIIIGQFSKHEVGSVQCPLYLLLYSPNLIWFNDVHPTPAEPSFVKIVQWGLRHPPDRAPEQADGNSLYLPRYNWHYLNSLLQVLTLGFAWAGSPLAAAIPDQVLARRRYSTYWSYRQDDYVNIPKAQSGTVGRALERCRSIPNV
jgi:hypothetical protein